MKFFKSRWISPYGLLFVALLFLGLGVCGCSDDEGSEALPPETLIYPSTPDKLMANYKAVYTGMMMDEFEDLLHPDFRMVLLQGTLAAWANSDAPLTPPYYDRPAEIAIHRNLFNGNTGLDTNGQPIPSVSSIEVVYLEKEEAWRLIPAGDPDFDGHDGYWAAMNVLIFLNCPDDHRFEVSQVIEFHVAPVDDAGQEKWLLLGIRETESFTKAVEPAQFGHIKAMYR